MHLMYECMEQEVFEQHNELRGLEVTQFLYSIFVMAIVELVCLILKLAQFVDRGVLCINSFWSSSVLALIQLR